MPERTEAPTPRRRRELRQQGQIARGPELAPALTLLVVTLMLNSYGVAIFTELGRFMAHTFQYGLTNQDWTVPAVHQGALALMLMLTRLMAPLLLVALVVGLTVNLVQTRFLFTLQALKPDLNKLNPIQWLKTRFSLRGLADLAKSLAKMLVIGFVVYQSLASNIGALAAMTGMELEAAIRVFGRVVASMALRVAVMLVLIAGLDYIYQRWQFERSIKMTKEEVKEERKQIEGSPEVRGRLRQRQRELIVQRMMQAVPEADVVVTNPTHLAVAVQYDAESMAAPTVVAKGQRLIAERIVQVAREHRVPVIRNVPLARALFSMVEVGEQIPAQLYQTMAEVLAFVYRLRMGRQDRLASVRE